MTFRRVDVRSQAQSHFSRCGIDKHHRERETESYRWSLSARAIGAQTSRGSIAERRVRIDIDRACRRREATLSTRPRGEIAGVIARQVSRPSQQPRGLHSPRPRRRPDQEKESGQFSRRICL